MSTGVSGDTHTQDGTFVGSGFYKTWDGANGKYEVTTGGKKRSRWNPFNRKWLSRQRNSNVWTCTKVTGGTYTVTVTSDVFMGPFSPSFPGNLVLEAQSRLVEQIKGHSFNLAVNAAQSGQLVDMVVHNLGAIGRSFLALRHGDFATAARQLGATPKASRLKPSDVSGRWLELQYGWLPALSDTYEAAKAYERITKGERTNHYRASASSKTTYETAGSPFYTAPLGVKQKVSIHAELYESLSAARSLGLLDPLSVAWEIIPYSFVVDWFIPIGTYLSTLAIAPHLTGRFMMTKSWVYNGSLGYKYLQPLPAFFGGFMASEIKYLGTDTVRGVYSERSIPTGLKPQRPSFDRSGLHGTRIWNAIALAQQRFR